MGKRGPQPRPAVERFWAKVEIGADDECWEWTAFCGPKGYGRFGIAAGVTIQAHRFAYENRVGPIPAGLQIDHLCRNPSCVNPSHLEPVTPKENTKRGAAGGFRAGSAPDWQRAKGSCPRGHEYTPENTYSPPSRPTARYCRQCHLEHTRERRAR